MLRQILFSLFMFSGVVAVGQTPCGIYATRADFLKSKVTYKFEDCKFKVQNNKDIVAKHSDQRLRFKFDFIFGYTDGKNLYRSYGAQSLWTDHGYYQVIYDEDIIVYARTSKDYRSNVHTFFYYSLKKDSPIYPLKRKFYDTNKGVVKVDLASLKENIGLPSNDEVVYASVNGMKPVTHFYDKKRSRTFLPDFKLQPDALNF